MDKMKEKEELKKILTKAAKEGIQTGYKLAVDHLKEAYKHNATTTIPEAIEWLNSNAENNKN